MHYLIECKFRRSVKYIIYLFDKIEQLVKIYCLIYFKGRLCDAARRFFPQIIFWKTKGRNQVVPVQLCLNQFKYLSKLIFVAEALVASIEACLAKDNTCDTTLLYRFDHATIPVKQLYNDLEPQIRLCKLFDLETPIPSSNGIDAFFVGNESNKWKYLVLAF